MTAPNIAIDRTPFFGRHGASQALQQAIRAGERLITVSGPSGIGKTRLTRNVAATMQPEYHAEGGVWFCDLTAARSPEALLRIVGAALGVSMKDRCPVDGSLRIAHATASRGPLLLVLDNFENLVPAAASVIARWLDEAPELQILTTSIVRLEIDGEWCFELGPLELDEAIALYEDRATRAWADLSFGSADRGAIADLVRRLDRLPLAIELAAARVRVLPPRTLLSRLDERFEILQTGRDERHASLEEAISVSWELLTPAEQQGLARASIFRGGFSLEAAEAILVGDPGNPPVLDLLGGLRAKALLQLEPSDPPRFSLYESVAAFASRELTRRGDRADAERRHHGYFLPHGEALAGQISGPTGPTASRQLLLEHENLLAVHRRTFDADPRIAARAGLAASVAAALQGAPASEAALLDGSVAAARRADEPILLARALRARAATSRRHGRLDEARDDLAEGLQLARAAGARGLEGSIFCESGALRARKGEFDQAEAELRMAVSIEEEVDDPELAGLARMGLGIVAESRGDLEISRERLEAGLAIFRRSGNFRYQALSLFNLGAVLSGLGRYEDARAALHEAQRVFRLVDDRASEADVILNLGSVAHTAGALDEAEEHLSRSLVLERQLGNRRFEALALTNLGLLAFERGELRLAWQRLHEAVSIFRETGDERHAIHTLPFFAAVEAVLGLVAEASSDFAEARRWFEARGDAGSLATLAILEGFLDLAQARIAAQDLRGDEAAALTRRAAARREDPLPAGARSSEGLVVARRLLERALASPGERIASWEPSESAISQGLVVGPNATWFTLDEGARVALGRRGAMRRILQGLVEQRLLAPGVGLNQEALSRIGWPGEQIHPQAAANRVYTSVRALRAAGLEDVLRRHADGYLLDPATPVSRASLRLQ